MEESRIFPVITLRALTVLPSMIVNFDISRPQSVRAVEQAMNADQQVFLVTQKDPQEAEPGEKRLYPVGIIARIRSMTRLPHGLVRVTVEGVQRGLPETYEKGDGCLLCRVRPAQILAEDWTEAESTAMMRALKDLFSAYLTGGPKNSQEILMQVSGADSLEETIRLISINLPLQYMERQQILNASDMSMLCDVLTTRLVNEIEVRRIRDEIQQKVRERVDKNQKEYILREQLKVIQEELGESLPLSEAEEFAQKLETLDVPDEIRERIAKEIRRYRSLGGNSAEASVARGFIETLLAMPWNKATTDREDLKFARKVLEEDHYGLEKVKERILEFLAVRSLSGSSESPILCLAGPPGTGKTSIARSIARALEKKYVRISLGGVRDEAEIRGHRRTYIGAMPGRIADGIRQAGVSNPLMLLDEIDKLGSSVNGDPSAAMLEVLDSEQNVRFQDHYLDMPLDLSQVLFIATANDLQSVPAPLRDRMEIIEVSSYTENEKFHIAREHLLPKQIKKHGLKASQLKVTDKALRNVISGYTREAGVRSLERKLGDLCRKAVCQVLEQGQEQVKVKPGNLTEYLGRPLYEVFEKNETDEAGIARGLAWTQAGGVTLEVEVSVMPGTGNLKLTGQIGDVMKESAQTALSYVRSKAPDYEVSADFFKEHDLHVHIPEGAVPKDGPSAGITMSTALLSAIAKLPVRSDTAMTGEVTLRGRVLPVGGLKEKLLAASMAGMKQVIVPAGNRREIEEISEEITGKLSIVYAKQMDQVLEHALAERSGKGKA
ncbi:MAG: endopeptidase La [Lachnospiraceae bacterium]|nr:endopeptidase La [Lachnospiraceae bacterium]